MKLLLALPPMAQFNMPYPATTYLTGYLKHYGHNVTQRDWSLETLLKILSPEGLTRIKQVLLEIPRKSRSDSANFFLDCFNDYKLTVDSVVHFLQGRDPSMALRIAGRTLLPEGPRFLPIDEQQNLAELFGSMGLQDKAKYLASLYIDDISDVIVTGVDSHFELARYGEKLANSAFSFSALNERLKQQSIIDQMLEELVAKDIERESPNVVGLSVPFPGNLLGALRVGQYIKKHWPKIKIVMGGGFVSTELRQLEDIRLFEYIDYLIFDDGEKPLENLLAFFEGKLNETDLLQTWYYKNATIIKSGSNSSLEKHTFKNHPGPTYEGLPISDYLSMCEMPNPMHRLWSDFRWNKLMLAHGCYWKKCTFCDTSLAYIQNFDPGRPIELVTQMERLIKETGQTGFHFVDEAAPPALLIGLSKEILRRKLKVSWWGNIRFDPQFTPEVCELMADAGCVAVTGGIEVACDRLLKLINKGITVEQVAKVSKNFSQGKIFVHAYLMYAFPSQTIQETIDGLEVVRQLFLNRYLNSAHWHRFACTVHSPVGKNPEKFGVQLLPVRRPKEGFFAMNEIPFNDGLNLDHDSLGKGLRLALYNYMLGIGLELDVREWFREWMDVVPKTTHLKNWLKSI